VALDSFFGTTYPQNMRPLSQREVDLLANKNVDWSKYFMQDTPIAVKVALPKVCAEYALEVLKLSRVYRGEDGSGMSGICVGAYDGTFMSKKNSIIRDMASIIHYVDGECKLPGVVDCADMEVMKGLVATCPDHRLIFRGANTINKDAGVDCRKIINDMAGKALYSLLGEKPLERATKVTIAEYTEYLRELGNTVMLNLIDKRPSMIVTRLRLLDHRLSPLSGGKIYYLPDPTPHNMLTTVVWLKDGIDIQLSSVPIDKFLAASMNANALRNSFFLHRRQVNTILDNKGLLHIPMVSIKLFTGSTKSYDLEDFAAFSATFGPTFEEADLKKMHARLTAKGAARKHIVEQQDDEIVDDAIDDFVNSFTVEGSDDEGDGGEKEVDGEMGEI